MLKPSFLFSVTFLLLASLAPRVLFSQTNTLTKTIKLVESEQSIDLEWPVELPTGETATEITLNFTTVDGSPLTGKVEITNKRSRNTFAGRRPFLYNTFTVQKIASNLTELRAELNYKTTSRSPFLARSGPQEPNNSVLASGEIHKLSVDDDDIFQIDKAFLDEIGISSQSPGDVRLYSKGGEALPEQVGAFYPVDLQEVRLLEIGNGDDVWDEGERLVFYGQGEDVWKWDLSREVFTRIENIYSEKTFYYLKTGGQGLRMQSRQSTPVNQYDNEYTNRVRWEEDLVNILQYSERNYNSGQGSGQEFFGFTFGTSRSAEKQDLWNLGTLVSGKPGKLMAGIVASALVSNSRFEVEVNGQLFTSAPIARSSRSNANVPFAKSQTILNDITLNDPVVDIKVNYPGQIETATGWLDYVQLTYPCQLIVEENPIFFRSEEHLNAGAHGFEIGSNTNLEVLDISNPLTPVKINTEEVNGTFRFGYVNDTSISLREFVAFTPSRSYSNPLVEGRVNNSNLHSISNTDLLIIYGEGLGAAANKLADHRRNHNGYEVEIASMQSVAEEFGGGRFDPTAIRAITKMIFERDPNFKYLVLMGDGTYDPRNIVERTGNLIPTYQTRAFNHEVTAFPTDDYFVLLSEGDGRDRQTYPDGLTDVAIGRFPVNNMVEANAILDKIIRYDSDPSMQGDWRLRNVFVSDDGDNNTHINDIESIADTYSVRYPEFNQVKVHADAFPIIPTPGGLRIPEAAEAINQNMFRGNLTTTYLGHGGPNGWAQERILSSQNIEKWNSRNSLPIFITATCTFTGFDNPRRSVAGERLLLKRDGGAVASVSTTRPVFTTANKAITDATHRSFFNKSLATKLGIGELLNRAKWDTDNNTQNNLKYSLFGDPSMRLAIPTHEVVLTNVDSIDVISNADTITVGPLQEVTLSGEIRDSLDQLLPNFNGEISITIYDQDQDLQTLGQKSDSRIRSFRSLGGVLFKGRSDVSNGKWTATFRLPKDVNPAVGLGRVSLYAFSENNVDAGGFFNRLSIDASLEADVQDDTPPIVEVFLGNEAFVSGSITSEDPVIIAKLSDDFGINVSGISIGHDLTATISGVQENNYVLNEFYQAEKNDYRKGTVEYPLFDLPEGSYELEVRAWDLSNNTNVGTTKFVVSDNAELALKRVLNYPNPFVDATCFQFEHNAAGKFVEIQVDIYTTSGRLVNSLRKEGIAEGFRFGNDNCIPWDGTDQFGQELARGVYLYKIKMLSTDDSKSSESAFEKLVVLK